VLDLGSNSFRLLLVRRQGELIEVVERVKEKVQLVRGFRGGLLDPAAIERAEACLQRYAQRLCGLPRDRIAMVGTHALREGQNRGALVAAAEAIMGVRLAILSGAEEAALIFRGVAMREPPAPRVGRFVLDIGGGSTEFAWGGSDGPPRVRSCMHGCVSLADRVFRQELPLGVAFDAARRYLQDALPAVERVEAGMDVIGTSGTVESIQAVLGANGWSDREITADGLAELVRALVEGRWDADTGMLGLAPERVDIFPAGVVLLDALFRRLGIRALRYVDAALEDGVMFGLLGADGDPRAVRAATVRGLQTRFGIDVGQARRVRDTALALFDQTGVWWPHERGGSGSAADWRGVLGFAAELHELGLVVAPRAYHRHGAYLLKHAELRGISAREHEYLALLVRTHRRSLPMLAFSGLAAAERRRLLRLAALLRIAVILERSHADGESPWPRATAAVEDDADRLVLTLPPPWPDRHPLSMRELERETGQLARAGIRFEFAAG